MPRSICDRPWPKARRSSWRAGHPVSPTPGPKATAFQSSYANREWFGWGTIAQQSLPLLSPAAHLQRQASMMRCFPLPAPGTQAPWPRRAKPISRQRVRRRPKRRLLLRPGKRRGRRTVRTIAATSTGMARRPGVRSGSTIGPRAVTRQGSGTTSGAHTVAGSR